MLECLAHGALASATALGWLGFGALVLAPLSSSGDRALDALNRLGAGALGFALLTFAAGWLGLLYAELYLTALPLAALGGLVWLSRDWPSTSLVLGRIRAWPRWQVAVAALLALYVLLAVLATCAPISSADALFYHAAAPELYEQRHELVEVEWSWQTYQPSTVEMLVLDGFLLWDSVQGAFAPLLLALGALAVVVGGACRVAGRSVALLAGAVFFGQPFMVWITSSTFVEPGLAFMLALACWNALRFARNGGAQLLVLAGIFAGGAAGMKYVGVAAAAVFAAAAALLLRRWLTPARALAFALPAVAVALPWYVKNALLTGNPVYPFLFGGANAEATEAAFASFREYGHGRSPLDLLLLPARLLGDADGFDRGEFASPLFLLFAPLAFLEPRARPAAAAAWGGAIVFVLSWFVGSQQFRFLAPLMPAFAVLAAVGITALSARGRVGRIMAMVVTTATLAVGLGVTLVYAAQFVPVVTGRESEREFLLENTSYHAGAEWLNRNLPLDAHVVIGHVFALYVDRPTVVWTSDVLETTAGAAETRAFIERYAITHAAVFERDGARRRQLTTIGARQIGRVTVRPVLSRTLNEVGRPETMVVFATM